MSTERILFYYNLFTNTSDYVARNASIVYNRGRLMFYSFHIHSLGTGGVFTSGGFCGVGVIVLPVTPRTLPPLPLHSSSPSTSPLLLLFFSSTTSSSLPLAFTSTTSSTFSLRVGYIGAIQPNGKAHVRWNYLPNHLP